jgi:hypothetical protein
MHVYEELLRQNNKSNVSTASAQQCTMEQLMKVRSQLSPELCVLSHDNHIPWNQKCSITTATIKTPWINQHYLERYNQHYESSRASLANNKTSSFHGISIGCNKGFDALNTFRMGTLFDESINKSLWKCAMTDNGTNPLHHSVYKQDRAEDTHLNFLNKYPAEGVIIGLQER